jgi:quercetin dioxygenase-like cupin family protein
MEPVRSSPATEVERRAFYAERPGFRIQEPQIAPSQEVPWHYHHEVRDTLYVLQGTLRVLLREPDAPALEAEVVLHPGETFTIPPGRAHRITNAGETSARARATAGTGWR